MFTGLLTRPSRRELELAVVAARMRQETAEQHRRAACGVAGRNAAHIYRVEEERDEAYGRISELEDQLAAALARAESAERELESAELELDVDPSTGLRTRRWLEANWSTLDPAPTGLLLIDLDGFKAVNDRYGHPVGDEVIRVVAARLPRQAGYVPARYNRGGDEFVLLLIGGQELVPTASLVGGAISAEIMLAGAGPVFVTASIGATTVTAGDEIEPLGAVVRRADVAMYNAKRAGCPVLWESDMVMPARRGGGAR
jgi:diguanylate cyclase (GGDEF)-like protein